MDGAIAFLLIGAVLFLASLFAMGRWGRSRSVRQSPWESKAARHRPFEPDGAKRLAETRVITGRAYVIDGDTLVISETQIRLFGIDAPEIDHPYGQKAKWELVALCKGQVVLAEVIE